MHLPWTWQASRGLAQCAQSLETVPPHLQWRRVRRSDDAVVPCVHALRPAWPNSTWVGEK